MTTRVFLAFSILEAVLIGAIFLLYPKITRHGLLFGVYVGEEASSGAEARRITRSWYRGMVAWIVASVVVGAALGAALSHPAAAVVPPLLLLPGFLVLYLLAYRRARSLARPGDPPPAVAVLAEGPVTTALFPAAALAVAVASGLFAVAYSWNVYDLLPDRVPTHFGLSGAPDAFRPKSFLTVMLSPLLTLVVGVGIAGVAWLTARAKRSLRYPASRASMIAQARFRRAMTRLLCWLSLIVSLFLTVVSVSTVRVGLGRAETLPPAVLVLAAALLVVALGGVVSIAVRYGQGGARLEETGTGARLTNGLADNRHWVLGMFCVNREDPSFLVEHRFGLGYTRNLGNAKAVALVGGFVLVVRALVILALAAT